MTSKGSARPFGLTITGNLLITLIAIPLFVIELNKFCLRFRCCDSCWDKCRRKREYKPRTIWLGRASPTDEKYPANVIRNQKYNVITFIPLVSLPLLRTILLSNTNPRFKQQKKKEKNKFLKFS